MVTELLSSALDRARERTLGAMELISIANQLNAAGASNSVAELYRVWIEHHPNDTMLHAIYFNFAVILSGAGDLQGAKAALEAAIQINPDFLPPYVNLGGLLERLGATGEGIQKWYDVVHKLAAVNGENLNYKTTALKQIGRVLERFTMDENAEQALFLSLELNPNQSDVIQHWVSLRQRQCKWPVITPRGALTKELLLKGISSLSLAAHTDDPLLQLANAAMYSKNSIGRPSKTFVGTHAQTLQKAHPRRRKIGYLSSDLREHAIGYLTAEVYGLHDRSKTEVFLYYCGHAVTDQMQARIKASGDHWLDLAGMSDEDVAQRMVDDGIEILIDVNGYTNGARTKVLAMRPAPIIVNWLGFPGTLGNPSHHYIIADEFIIPKEHEIYYSEKVVHLPCYQPNDRQRIISNRTPSRQEVGLPDDAVVYCCFNGAHKITPFTWRRWMTILQQVPNSVLWLLDSIESTNDRLKKLAAAHGIAPERIIFAVKARNPDHLARYPLADIFLDTSPYGAHTTCSDALWMGVPVVTLVGRSFASRVCGSLVKSAGIGELICYSSDEFIALAINLAQDKTRLQKIREKLQAARDTCVLFDTPRLVSELERLYAQMWDDFKSGNLPRPDLSNLDVYNDVGIEIENNDVELLTVPNYQELYRQKLEELHQYSFLRSDARLWTGLQVRQPQAVATITLTEDPAKLLQSASAEVQAGNLEKGEQLVARCLALEPQNAVALDFAARVALLRGKLDAADAFARRAVQARPIITFGLTLAEIMKAKGDLKGAERFFSSVLDTQPREQRALIGLGEVCEQTGRRARAIECYEGGLQNEPGNTALAIRYSSLLSIPDFAKGLAALNKAAPPPTAPLKVRLNYLYHLAMCKESSERTARGLMPYHSTQLSDAFFHFAQAERDAYGAIADQILAIDPFDQDGLSAKAAQLFSLGRRLESEPFFEKIAKSRPETVFENVVFKDAFYERLAAMDDAALTQGLPPVTDVVTAKFSKKPIIYLSCNHQYFVDFARPMLLSIDAQSDASQVHLHLMDATDDELSAAKAFAAELENTKVAISAENPNVASKGLAAARGYYHAIRFIRLYQHLQLYKKPLWLMDVDALLNRDPQPMFAALKDADVAFRARPGRWEPWNQFNASVMGIRPTESAFEYLRLIAAFIATFHQQGRLRWGIDQLAMYGVHEFLKDHGRAPNVALLGDRAVDYEYYDDGFVWCNSGKGKFSQSGDFEKVSQIPEDYDRAKYLNILKKYTSRLPLH